MHVEAPQLKGGSDTHPIGPGSNGAGLCAGVVCAGTLGGGRLAAGGLAAGVVCAGRVSPASNLLRTWSRPVNILKPVLVFNWARKFLASSFF